MCSKIDECCYAIAKKKSQLFRFITCSPKTLAVYNVYNELKRIVLYLSGKRNYGVTTTK